jgi:DNA repair protein RadC
MLRFGSSSISISTSWSRFWVRESPESRYADSRKKVLNQVTESTHAFDIDKLMVIAGMGEAKSCAVAAAIELGRRIFSTRGTRIAMPKDAFPRSYTSRT